jgi:hypothetical protein
MPIFNSQCTVTLQQEVDILQGFGDLEPILNVGGQTSTVILTAANNVMSAICGVPFPHKWNEYNLPQFYTNSLQQDYAVVNPDGSSITNLAWLERGIVIDINNTAEPKPYRLVETGRQLSQSTGTVFNGGYANSPMYLVNWIPNNLLYYGTWGQNNIGNASFGNNPGPGSVFIDPLGASVSAAVWVATAGGQITFSLNYIPNGLLPGTSLVVTGITPVTYNNSYNVVSISGNNVVVTATMNPGIYEAGGIIGNIGGAGSSMPNNPMTQIKDSNGNLLLLTEYGTEGATAPTAPPNTAPGTLVQRIDATTVWTVLDPFGQGFRILPVPVQTGLLWQFNLVGQMKPVRFTSTNQTLAPFPDEFETHFQMGLIAQLYRFSPQAKIYNKFPEAWRLWLKSLDELRSKEDREMEENMFVPDRGIMGGTPGRNRFLGPQWPFNYPTR